MRGSLPVATRWQFAVPARAARLPGTLLRGPAPAPGNAPPRTLLRASGPYNKEGAATVPLPAAPCARASLTPLVPPDTRSRGSGASGPRATRGCSSAGRALESHSRGQGFETPQLHSSRCSSWRKTHPSGCVFAFAFGARAEEPRARALRSAPAPVASGSARGETPQLHDSTESRNSARLLSLSASWPPPPHHSPPPPRPAVLRPPFPEAHRLRAASSLAARSAAIDLAASGARAGSARRACPSRDRWRPSRRSASEDRGLARPGCHR